MGSNRNLGCSPVFSANGQTFLTVNDCLDSSVFSRNNTPEARRSWNRPTQPPPGAMSPPPDSTPGAGRRLRPGRGRSERSRHRGREALGGGGFPAGCGHGAAPGPGDDPAKTPSSPRFPAAFECYWKALTTRAPFGRALLSNPLTAIAVSPPVRPPAPARPLRRPPVAWPRSPAGRRPRPPPPSPRARTAPHPRRS